MPRLLSSLVVLICLAAPAVAAEPPPCPGPTTALVVRHAEKEAGKDPDLTPEGHARARALAHVSRQAGVEAIYTSTLKRTIQTADPTEAATGVAAREFQPGDTEGIAADIVAAHAGKTVLVVGHSNTVDDVVEHLGGPASGDLDHGDYDNLLVVTRACDGTAHLLVLQFGEPAPAPPAP